MRIVLLARDVGDWWHSLRQRDEAVGHLLAEYEPTLVAPVTLEGDLRQRVWEHARDAFVTCLDKPAPPAPANLKDDRFGRVLYLHMSALAAVEELPMEAGSLLEEILTHEKHFWTKRYEEQFGDDGFEAAEFLKRCSRLVTAVTLHGGAPSREAAEELNQRVEGPDPRYKHLVPLLRSLYPGRGRAQDRYLGGLEPDLLGEALVRAVLTDPDTAPDTFLERVFAGADDLALQNGFVVLGRISLRDAAVAEPWLTALLDADAPRRAAPAFRAALALGAHTAFAPLGQILARALEREGTLDHAAEFDSLVPEQTVSLRELGVWTARRLLEFLSSQPETQENTIERARLLNNLGNRLSDLGRREEALAAAQEAVDIRRRLAESRPDAFLPYLATSLNNLGPMLSELGRREEALAAAQEAVGIYRRLAESRPETFLPYLAASLNNLGLGLRDLGRREEALAVAQEAVDIKRRLAEFRPEAFLPDLAGSLINFANALSDLRRREEALSAAQEAVDTWRRLAEPRPDAFLPDLAMSLNNLGNRLHALGRRDEALVAAQEAVNTYRRLAATRPEAFLPYVAGSLNNLGSILSELGRGEEALDAAREAVDTYRRLAESRPDAFLPNLARSLGGLGTCLATSARLREAVEALAEAVRTLGPPFSKLPEAFSKLMANLVSDYLEHAKELGETPDMDLLGPILAKLEEIKSSS